MQQYYEAQAQKDADAALAFWSAVGESPADARGLRRGLRRRARTSSPSRFSGSRSRASRRASASARAARDRRCATDVPSTSRQRLLNSQLWRKEAAGWKLLRDGPFADEFADELIAAPPCERPALFENIARIWSRRARDPRSAPPWRSRWDATTSRGKALFELALEVSRAAGDRPGEANSLHNIAQADYFLAITPPATGVLRAGARARPRDRRPGRDRGGAVRPGHRGLFARRIHAGAGALPGGAGDLREAGRRRRRSAAPLVSIGNVQYLQAEYDAATASYRRALALLVTGWIRRARRSREAAWRACSPRRETWPRRSTCTARCSPTLAPRWPPIRG